MEKNLWSEWKPWMSSLNCRPTCLPEGQRKTVACYEAECPKVTEINSQGNKKVNTKVITGCLAKAIKT